MKGKRLSIQYRLLSVLMRFSGMKLLCNANEKFLKKFLVFFRKIQKNHPPNYFYRRYNIETKECCGSRYFVISKKDIKIDKALMFIHGGAWIMEMNLFQWKVIKRILDSTDVNIYIPNYLLAPEHKSIEALNLLTECYYDMCKVKYKEITFLGDSAGAQIAISFVQRLRELGQKQPSKCIVVSPPVTLIPDSNMEKKMKEIEKKDVMLSLNLLHIASSIWMGELSADDYRVSPLYGEFKEICPIYVFVGTSEILYPQALALKEKILTDGGSVYLYEGERMMHTWTHLPWAPESMDGLNQIIYIIKNNING